MTRLKLSTHGDDNFFPLENLASITHPLIWIAEPPISDSSSVG